MIFAQCQKTELQQEKTAQTTELNEKQFTNEVEAFVNNMNAVKNGGLTTRSGPYTLTQLLSNVSNGINYEYNHPSTFNNVKFQFLDTITIVNANNAYSDAQAATVYQAVLNKASQQAGEVVSANVYLLSVGLRPISSTSSTINIAVYGTYVNGTSALPPTNDTIYMPDSRFFDGYGSCTNWSDESVIGAAMFLQNWCKRVLMSYPTQVNTYLGNMFYLENAYSFEEGDCGPNHCFSLPFKYALIEINVNDPTPANDGFFDRKTKAFTFPNGNAAVLQTKGCTSPSEMDYYAPNAKSILNNQLSIHNRDYFTYIEVWGRYQNYPNTASQFASWVFYTWCADVIHTDGPIPQKDITEPG